jgi:hypothetical protein
MLGRIKWTLLYLVTEGGHPKLSERAFDYGYPGVKIGLCPILLLPHGQEFT